MVYPGSVMMVLTHYRKMHPYIFRHWVFLDLMNKLVIINISTVICKKRNVFALCLNIPYSNGQTISYDKSIKEIRKFIEATCFTLDISFLYLVSRLFCLCCFSKPSFNIYPTLIKTYYSTFRFFVG